MGYQVDCKRVNSDAARFYVTKYLTKDQARINIKGLRHTQTTRAIGSPKPQSEYSWSVGTHLYKTELNPHTVMTDLDTLESIALDDLAWHERYPPEKPEA